MHTAHTRSYQNEAPAYHMIWHFGCEQETCGALAESIAFLRPALDEIQLSRCVQQLSHEYGVLLWDQISFVPNTHCTCQALWKEAEVS